MPECTPRGWSGREKNTHEKVEPPQTCCQSSKALWKNQGATDWSSTIFFGRETWNKYFCASIFFQGIISFLPSQAHFDYIHVGRTVFPDGAPGQVYLIIVTICAMGILRWSPVSSTTEKPTRSSLWRCTLPGRWVKQRPHLVFWKKKTGLDLPRIRPWKIAVMFCCLVVLCIFFWCAVEGGRIANRTVQSFDRTGFYFLRGERFVGN